MNYGRKQLLCKLEINSGSQLALMLIKSLATPQTVPMCRNVKTITISKFQLVMLIHVQMLLKRAQISMKSAYCRNNEVELVKRFRDT